MYGKFGFMIFLIFLILLYLPLIMQAVPSKNYHIPIENRTCEEIYNGSIHRTLFEDDAYKPYNTETIIIYYEENCLDKK